MTDTFKIKTINDLYNHIAYVVIYGPDRFPYRDFLAIDDQMNLDKAFTQLREGVEIAYPEDFHPEKKPMLYALLDQSLAAYRAGEDIKAAHLLQDLQDNIFEPSQR